jgi:SAM-dependent methyltransferase
MENLEKGYFVNSRKMMYNVRMHPWEQEYRNPTFITMGTEPIADMRDFMKWLRRKQKVDTTDFVVFDAGCGNGKNVKYAVEHFCASGIGYDISKTAIDHAKGLRDGFPIDYHTRSIGEPFELPDDSVDLIIDTTSSHALNAHERSVYLSEASRILKPGGYYFLRTLAIEGDTNAKNLIKEFPGTEPNTYILPGTGMTERVFSKSDIERDFADFNMLHMEKTSGYQKWGNQSYKRNYWIVYLQKR